MQNEEYTWFSFKNLIDTLHDSLYNQENIFSNKLSLYHFYLIYSSMDSWKARFVQKSTTSLMRYPNKTNQSLFLHEFSIFEAPGQPSKIAPALRFLSNFTHWLFTL